MPKKRHSCTKLYGESIFWGLEALQGVLRNAPQHLLTGLNSKRSAEVPQNRKTEYCSFRIFLVQFLSFLGPIWVLFGAARGLFLLSFQLLIPPLAPLCLSRMEMAGKSVSDPISGDYLIRN